MKKLIVLSLALTFAAFTSTAMADDVTISVKKAGDTKAKVTTWPGDKNETVVPIKFDDGASWDSVKDSYTVAPDVEDGIKAKSITLSVGTDGTLTFHKGAKVVAKKK